ncbi:MAG: hypothetical protein HWN67_14015 [Candidatus Helarchaeota archaeon]|nr:hypothetical protein [Candidatus Helarchaeota archaeon]
MDENKPIIEKVILPKFLHKYAIERGQKTSSEVGFYIVGLIRGKIAYCYDLIEFDYYEQGPTYVETNFAKDFRLRAGLPIGLEILGNMHKHPGRMLGYSNTDKETFSKYARDTHNRNVFIIYVLSPDELVAYNAVDDKVHKIESEVRNLNREERLKTYHFTIPINFQLCGPKDSKFQDLRFNFISNAAHEVGKCLSRPILLYGYQEIPDKELLMNIDEIEVIPFVPIDIKLGQNFNIAYRFFLPANAKIEDLYERITKDFKISPTLELFLGDKELDKKIKLLEMVGKILNLKEKEFEEKIGKIESVEQLKNSLNSLRRDLEEISIHTRSIRNIDDEFEKIHNTIKDIEKRLKKLEGKDDKKDSDATLDKFMRYG